MAHLARYALVIVAAAAVILAVGTALLRTVGDRGQAADAPVARATVTTPPLAWTNEPTPAFDPERFARLPAVEPAGAAYGPAFRLRVTRPARLLDGVTFWAFVGDDPVMFRAPDLDPVAFSRLCRGADGRRSACGGRGRAALAAALNGQELDCRPLPSTEAGRLLARCALGRLDLGAWLVREGLAVPDPAVREAYARPLAEAMLAQRGVWADDEARLGALAATAQAGQSP